MSHKRNQLACEVLEQHQVWMCFIETSYGFVPIDRQMVKLRLGNQEITYFIDHNDMLWIYNFEHDLKQREER